MLCENGALIHLLECKHAGWRPASSLIKVAKLFPEAKAIQLVRALRQEEYRHSVSIVKGADWLAELAA